MEPGLSEARGNATHDAAARCLAGFNEGLAYVVMLLGTDLRIEWISPSVEGLIGWSAADLIGTNAIELIHPGDLAEVATLLADELTTPHRFDSQNLGAYSTNVVRVKRRDNGWQSVEFAGNNQMANPEVGGMVLVLRDITERQLVDDVYGGMLRGASLAEVVGTVSSLLSWQLGGRLVEITVATLDPGEPTGVAEVHVSHGSAHTNAMRFERTLVDVRAVLTVHLEPTAEHTAWFDLLISRAAGMLRLAVVRHVGEQRLRQQAEEADQQRRRAEALSRALDEKAAIMSAVSHDLSSPLAAIRLMSNLLDGSSESLSEVQRSQLAQRISNDALRTTKLLTDLTSIDRLLGGAAKPTRQRLRVDHLVARVIEHSDAPDHALRQADGLEGLVCIGDPVLVERILDNLVTNAVKYTPSGCLIVVGATLDRELEQVRLYVDDEGPGLPATMHTSVFDAYVRGEDTQQRPGSGIGLFLVRTFAEVQDGRAWYETAPCGGSRFVVALPAG